MASILYHTYWAGDRLSQTTVFQSRTIFKQRARIVSTHYTYTRPTRLTMRWNCSVRIPLFLADSVNSDRDLKCCVRLTARSLCRMFNQLHQRYLSARVSSFHSCPGQYWFAFSEVILSCNKMTKCGMFALVHIMSKRVIEWVMTEFVVAES